MASQLLAVTMVTAGRGDSQSVAGESDWAGWCLEGAAAGAYQGASYCYPGRYPETDPV